MLRTKPLRLSWKAALWGVGFAAILAGLVTYHFASPRTPPLEISGFTATAASPNAADIAFVNQEGTPRTFRDYRGQVVAVFFGFTRCPDVCPTRLFELARLMQQLGSDRRGVQVLFVTLDPERDTPGVMKTYLAAFDPSFAGATGTAAQIKSLAAQFYVANEKVPLGDDYTMDHSAATYLIDPTGQKVYVSGVDTSPAQVLQGIRALLANPQAIARREVRP